MKRLITLLCTCLCVLSGPGQAGGYGGRDSTDSGNFGSQILNNATTNSLIRLLKRDFERCNALPWSYRYDCYDDAYFRGARKIANNPAYAPVAAVLSQVGTKIEGVLAKNIDPAKPPLRKGLKSYKAIKDSARASAKAEVVDAIAQAETILLRSPDDGGDHFTRIAAALESNKVLLRSAWLFIARIVRLA